MAGEVVGVDIPPRGGELNVKRAVVFCWFCNFLPLCRTTGTICRDLRCDMTQTIYSGKICSR